MLKSDDTESVLQETVSRLRDMLRSIEGYGNGEHGSTVQEVARLSVALVTAAAELRQHAKAARRQLSSYSVGDITDYLKTLPDAKRKELARELSGSDDNEPLL